MYLLFVVQEESSYAEKFLTWEEAKSSFEDAIEETEYNIAVALYDFNKDSHFGISDYGFDGDPIESWHNEDW